MLDFKFLHNMQKQNEKSMFTTEKTTFLINLHAINAIKQFYIIMFVVFEPKQSC